MKSPKASIIRAGLLAGIALSGLAISAPVLAQDQMAPAADESEGEIVVTARRTEERLETVPGSVSAFSEDTLERIQATDTTGLQGAVPNLNIVQGRGSSNATNIYIRGIGQPDALQTFDPAVGVYVDDVYYSRIRGTQLDLLDLERVEVLRGPQGTLYGKNTIAGALKVVTRKPGQDFRGTAGFAVGNYGQLEQKLAASGPVSETVAAGFAVMHARRDGYVKDAVLDRDYNDKNTIAARGALAFTPSERFRFDVSVDYSRDDASLTVGQPLNSLTYLVGGGTALALPLNPDPENYNFVGRTTPSLPNSTKLQHWGTSGTATLDVTDALTLKSITAYRNLTTKDYVDIDATQLEIGDVFVDVAQNQFSQEFQAAYTGDRLQVVGGIYYLKENITSHQEAYADNLLGPLLGNPTFTRTIDDDLQTKSYAAYANASLEIVDNLRVSGGVRYTREEKDYFRTTSTFSSFLPLTSVAPYVFKRNGVWKDVSPMASIDYRFDEQTMVYARLSKGFKSGGFNGRANTVAESTAYEPEEVISYEVGFKARIANQLRLAASVFHNDYKDFQARVSGLDVDPVTNLPAPVLSVLNAGKLRIRGAELEVNWTPMGGLMLDAQIGYLDAKYQEFDDARFPGGSRAFQTPAFAPDWTMRFGAQYSFDLGTGGSLTLGGQTRYRSETALAVDNTYVIGTVGTSNRIEGLFQPSFWMHDARLVWESDSKAFNIGIYGQNLSDKNYKTDGQDFSSIGSVRTVYYGAPRTFTVRLSTNF